MPVGEYSCTGFVIPDTGQTPEEVIDELLTDALEKKGHAITADSIMRKRLKTQMNRSPLFALCNVVDFTELAKEGKLDQFMGPDAIGIVLDLPNGCSAAVYNDPNRIKGPRYAVRMHNIMTPRNVLDMDVLRSGDKDIVDLLHDGVNGILQELEASVISTRRRFDQSDLVASQILIFEWPKFHIKKEAYHIEYFIRASVGVAAVALTGDATCQHPYLKSKQETR